MKMMCFLVLNYNGLEETKNCIESILSLNQNDKIKIIVVDNASEDQSGIRLNEIYDQNPQVSVLCAPQNLGYSAGNNYGFSHLIKQYRNVDYLVVCNSDTIFVQKDFAERIHELYQLYCFDILGPDIFVPHSKEHQNPMCESAPTTRAVNRTIVLNSIGIAAYPVLFPIIKTLLVRKATKKGESKNHLYQQENICLHGSCIIYAKKFFAGRDKIFFPETHFYYEEFIQWVHCQRHEKKMIYSPSIQVWHLELRSIFRQDKTDYKGIKRMMKRMISAAIVYKNYLASNE